MVRCWVELHIQGQTKAAPAAETERRLRDMSNTGSARAPDPAPSRVRPGVWSPRPAQAMLPAPEPGCLPLGEGAHNSWAGTLVEDTVPMGFACFMGNYRH